MYKVIAALALAIPFILMGAPASADTPNCFSWSEYQDIVVGSTESTGWHRQRVLDHVDVNPSNTIERDEGPFERQDEWGYLKSCDGFKSYTVKYNKYVVGPTVYWNAGAKCFLDNIYDRSGCAT